MSITMRKFILLLASHGFVLAAGFALGIYFLPILTAPSSPDSAALQQAASNAMFKAEFKRDLKGSDLFHWGGLRA